jgi:CRP-like cAMP-binding protein
LLAEAKRFAGAFNVDNGFAPSEIEASCWLSNVTRTTALLNVVSFFRTMLLPTGTGILSVGEQTSPVRFPENADAGGGLLAEKERGARQSGDLVLSNEILARLPVGELDQIVGHLEHQHIPRHTVLCDPEKPIRYGYFLNSGMVSCLIPTSAGRNVEVALVGKGGFIGNSLAFGVNRSLLRIIMQVPGDGYRIKSDDLQRLLPTAPHLFRSLGRHALLQGMQAAQTAACNRLHNLEQRLARWLLMTQDRVGPEFAMTQEYLAQMLGTGRPSLSLTASQMQRWAQSSTRVD